MPVAICSRMFTQIWWVAWKLADTIPRLHLLYERHIFKTTHLHWEDDYYHRLKLPTVHKNVNSGTNFISFTIFKH